MKQLTCVIIDDEPSSQNVLKHFIAKVDFLDLKGCCKNAMDALAFLNETPVDLLFLDINMPTISGVTFYKSLPQKPYVIFTTAYSEHAVEGFELNAVDYLLKPFSFERFFTAINKVPVSQKTTDTNDDFILIKADKKLHKVNLDDIVCIEAYGDYVKVHTENGTLVTYSTFSGMQQQLPDAIFLQTHKSYVVHKNKVEIIDGNQVIIPNFKIPIGQKYKADFLNKLSFKS